MMIIYHDEHGDLTQLAGRLVGVLGYGNMGRPVALNLRDSGIDVIITDPSPDKQFLAAEEGFSVVDMPQLAQQADVILPLVRDELAESLT